MLRVEGIFINFFDLLLVMRVQEGRGLQMMRSVVEEGSIG